MPVEDFGGTVIEWFSGIGGLRFAFESLFLDRIKQFNFTAFDINEIANRVYATSFNGDVPRVKSIESLSISDIEALNGSIWLLSPPCQPYTLGGSQLDEKDPRAKALLHLISVLDAMKNPPEFLFLENVPKFEYSNTRTLLVDVLTKHSYSVEEYLIAPIDPAIAIPNSRLRYYLLVKRNPSFLYPSLNGAIVKSLEKIGFYHGQFSDGKKLSDYILPSYSMELLVPIDTIKKEKGFRFDIISTAGVPLGYRSNISGMPSCSTFTKGYGSNRIRGTGSLILLNETASLDVDNINILLEMGLRYFSPEEISALHAFPTGSSNDSVHFLKFPESITMIQKFRLLGNSLNVKVVAILLSRLFSISVQKHSVYSS